MLLSVVMLVMLLHDFIYICRDYLRRLNSHSAHTRRTRARSATRHVWHTIAFTAAPCKIVEFRFIAPPGAGLF